MNQFKSESKPVPPKENNAIRSRRHPGQKFKVYGLPTPVNAMPDKLPSFGQVIEFHTVPEPVSVTSFRRPGHIHAQETANSALRAAVMQTLIAANGHEAKQTNPSSTPAPGPKSVQEQSVGATEASETEKVYPSPAPSPETATCGSAPGREVGVGTDKDSAQDEPLSKKKALEWARIENLDHNKVNLEAKLNASKAAAKITAETVEKNKNDSKRQNIEEATPGSAPDAVCSGSRQVTPPAEATPGSAKAGISRTQFEKNHPTCKEQ